MSHGFGKWQKVLLTIIRRHGEPMTFAEIRGPDDERLPAAVERAAPRGTASIDRGQRAYHHRPWRAGRSAPL